MSQTTAVLLQGLQVIPLRPCLRSEEHDVTQPPGALSASLEDPPGPCFPQPPGTSGPKHPALPCPAKAPAGQNSPFFVVTTLTLQLKA